MLDGPNLVQEQASGGAPTANVLTGLGIDESFTRTDATGTSTLLTDALDSILELADTSGTLQTHYTFEPFGVTTSSGGKQQQCAAVYRSRERREAAVLLPGAVLQPGNGAFHQRGSNWPPRRFECLPVRVRRTDDLHRPPGARSNDLGLWWERALGTTEW